MANEPDGLAETIKAMRPMVPARDFDTSQRFYVDLGFRLQMLTDRLAEMRFGTYSFFLQDYYVREWADNFVMHMLVTDLERWWTHISRLDLPSRYGTKTKAPQAESWGRVAGFTDPSGVLWRLTELHARDAAEV
jgi:catechol 2,3-dioxygenase-like lactoylglutathione lyase family enzyme